MCASAGVAKQLAEALWAWPPLERVSGAVRYGGWSGGGLCERPAPQSGAGAHPRLIEQPEGARPEKRRSRGMADEGA